MKRRAFLAGLGSVSLAALSGGCGPRSARELALSGTVERVLLPDSRSISEHSRALHTSLLQLPAAGSPEALAQPRAAWRSAALAWQRGAAFPHGPYVDTKALLHACFWPVRAEQIAAMVAASDPIDARRVEQLGVNTKGMFAIERLLFDEESPGVPWLLGTRRERALVVIRAFAADVLARAERAAAALGDGQAFMREFARGGQANLNRLVNELIRTVETTVMRLERVRVSLTFRGFSARDVQGGPSGTSTELAAALLAVSERVYGAGAPASLASLVQGISPAMYAHTTAAFSAARAALSGLGKPLERVGQTEPTRLLAAKHTIRQLETVLRSELASALGVTITFTSGDGD